MENFSFDGTLDATAANAAMQKAHIGTACLTAIAGNTETTGDYITIEG